MIQAIREVSRDRTFLEPALAQQLAQQPDGDPVELLSDKEFKVFLFLARGKSVAEIADVMCLSSSTIGTHLYHIKQKLGVANSAELAIIAMRHGLSDV